MIKKREVELKLEFDPACIDEFLTATVFTECPGRNHTQTSTYFDTPDHILRKTGLSLRIRAIGQRRIQTIKDERAPAAGLFARPEWEFPIEGDFPILEGTRNPVQRLVAAHDLERLVPIFRIVVERETRDIEVDDARIELVFDRGQIIAGYHTVPICEVELELREGAPETIFALARMFDVVTPLRLSVLSKAQQGYRLLDGNADQPVRWTPLLLTDRMTASDGFEAIAYACVRQFRLNQLIVERLDCPEAVHQARVALRRLRSAMAIFKTTVADDRLEYLKQGLRWIGRELDDARNLDVLLAHSPDVSVQLPLNQMRVHAYATARAALSSPRLRTLTFDLVEWITIGNWRTRYGNDAIDRQLDSFAAKALDQCRRRVKQRGRHWKRLDDKGRHKLRIEAKKLRYAADDFDELFAATNGARRRKPFQKALRALLGNLGILNDRITGAALLGHLGVPNPANQTLKDSGKEEKLLLKASAKDFRKLISEKRFWR